MNNKSAGSVSNSNSDVQKRSPSYNHFNKTKSRSSEKIEINKGELPKLILSRFAEFLPLIYPPELEAKETTDTVSSASFLDLYLEFNDSGQIYDKRDDFNFMIINFPNIAAIYQLLLHMVFTSHN